ncbi:MAG TPA: ABC transporter ATP-binding protein [Conexivisphaerales archaeon]|nr:ABC transporter ATP-binding protein [Conexivisphaerales archaeon]
MTAIEVVDLCKTYPPDLRAVDDVSFEVDDGEIFGLLGPNGAGKTTTIKMIIGLTRPSTGAIRICGLDALSSASQVRELLGYVPQAISADGDLTGYENLLIFAKLFYVQKKDRDPRIREALEEMGLTDRANDLVKHYSGGMMRRLEIAESVVSRPRVLFLDEPSIGLDPSSKRQVWKHIRRLNEELKMTVLITTHDMAEADELCDRIAIMNQGRFVASGTPEELKHGLGGDMVTVKLSGKADLPLPPDLGRSFHASEDSVDILTENGETAIPRIVAFYEQNGSHVLSMALSKPTLDDVFLKYAKVRIEEAERFAQARQVRRSFMRHAG